MERISIVVPCYNEEESIRYFYNEIIKITLEMPFVEFEILFVDDGSKDNTLDVVKELNSKDCRVRYISFSRNFGKESAMYAGLENATGDYVAIMDVDLQDPPSLLKGMYYTLVNENFDCIATRRTTRNGEPFVRSFFAKCFYRLINWISEIEIVDGARDFRMMKRQMTDAILKVTEYNRFSKGIFQWVGFKTKWLEYENVERVVGQTKWSFWKLFLYSLEGLVAFSTTPLAIASIIGFIFCILSFLMICVISVRQLIWGGSAYGWSSLVCIIFFISGVQLFCIGIVGQYLSKAYLEAKKRPIYIIRELSEDNITIKHEQIRSNISSNVRIP